MSQKLFSTELEQWLKSKHPKTIYGLGEVFAERSFAALFILLMIPAALPLPTGGVTHVFEIIVVLLALELIAGRKSVWVPKRWRHINIGKPLEKKALPLVIKIIRWFERFSRPRFRNTITSQAGHTLIGLLIIFLTIVAFIAPPFSGLDTLPSAGVVILSLGILLGDIIIVFIGLIVGLVGVALTALLGSLLVKTVQHLF